MAGSLTYFQGRELAIVSKHKKEEVIIPAFKNGLGLSCRIESRVDTDLLGTFSGEIPRKLDQVSAARQKCLLAIDIADCDLVLSSEGSFGPHPSLFFLPSDFEILYLIDRKNNWELKEQLLSTDTNYASSKINNEKELEEFAAKSGFPQHGIILRPFENSPEGLIKNTSTTQELLTSFGSLLQKYNSVFAETDMRAMRNPTRMRVIEKLAHKLCDRLLVLCPQCETPGFGVEELIPGLQCALCGNETRLPKAERFLCKACNFEQTKLTLEKTGLADPSNCDYCNP